jgi:hypothetical protein
MDFKQWFYQEAIDLNYIDNPQTIERFAKEAIRWMDWSGGDGDGFRDDAKYELYGNVNSEDENNEAIEKRALELAHEFLIDRLYDVIYDYKNFGDPLRLFREITVSGKNKQEIIRNIHLIHLGPFWTHTESSAEAHWGKFQQGYVRVVLYAEVPSQNVNWEHTLIKNAVPSYSEEKEVELKDGLSIKISKIRIDRGKWQKVNLTGFI